LTDFKTKMPHIPRLLFNGAGFWQTGMGMDHKPKNILIVLGAFYRQTRFFKIIFPRTRATG
jgi:hypothetical protein